MTSVKSPSRLSRRGSKTNKIVNIKAKPSILKGSARIDKESNTFSKATFGGASITSQGKLSIDEQKETLTFPLNSNA